MKTLYSCLALLFLSYNSEAQLTLTKSANEPIASEIWTMVELDSTQIIQKGTGTGQLWDFQSFANPGFTETITYSSPSSAPGNSLFPTANLAGSRNANNHEFYKTSASTFEFLGFNDVNSNSQMVLTDPALFMVWPMSYGTTSVDVASGSQSIGSGSITMNATVSLTGSGTGTVIMPDGTQHNNCLQIIHSLTIAATMGTLSGTTWQRNYIWYSSAKKFRIAEMQYSLDNMPGGSGNTFYAAFEKNGVPVGVQNAATTKDALRVYPVPASDEICVENGSEVPARLELYDMNGRLIVSSENSRTITVAEVPEGNYLLKIFSGEKERVKAVTVSR